MFHRRTKFAFGNGALDTGYGGQVFITSYDYRAPLNETGRPEPIFNNFKTDLVKYVKNIRRSRIHPL